MIKFGGINKQWFLNSERSGRGRVGGARSNWNDLWEMSWIQTPRTRWRWQPRWEIKSWWAMALDQTISDKFNSAMMVMRMTTKIMQIFWIIIIHHNVPSAIPFWANHPSGNNCTCQILHNVQYSFAQIKPSKIGMPLPQQQQKRVWWLH
jgi:hypothetical protein